MKKEEPKKTLFETLWTRRGDRMIRSESLGELNLEGCDQIAWKMLLLCADALWISERQQRMNICTTPTGTDAPKAS